MVLGHEVWMLYGESIINNREIYDSHPLLTIFIALMESNSIRTEDRLHVIANNSTDDGLCALGALSAILVYCVANNVDVSTLNIPQTQTFIGYFNALRNHPTVQQLN
jgi:hypothetical protein